MRAFEEVRQEWATYEMTLTSYMERMNAWAARQAKRDRHQLSQMMEVAPDEQTPETTQAVPANTRDERIAAARRRLAAAPRGG